jgi:hypothetical protein
MNEMNYSFGASDDMNERYASTALCGYNEAFCDYEGDMTFAEFKAACKEAEAASRRPAPAPMGPELPPAYGRTDDDPF